MRLQFSFAFAASMASCLAINAPSAHAVLIAADSFQVPPYVATDITTQSPAVTGFSAGWEDGTTATATFAVNGTGLNHPTAIGEVGGRATYNGFDGLRLVRRDLAAYSAPPAPVVLYMSGLIRLDTAADVTVGTMNVAGLVRNNIDALTDTQFFDPIAANNVEGLMWGFAGNGTGVDLILRHRLDIDPTATQTIRQVAEVLESNVATGDVFQIVMKIEMNAVSTTTGNDLVSIWLNPGSVPSESSAGPADFIFSDFSLSGATFIQRLVLANNNFGNQVSYDEIRFGTTFSDVVLFIPEPATATLGLLALAAVGLRRRRA